MHLRSFLPRGQRQQCSKFNARDRAGLRLRHEQPGRQSYVCTLTTATGALSGCATSDGGISDSSWIPFGVTTATLGSSSFAYVGDNNGYVFACSVSASTGDLSSCAISNGGISGWSPDGLTAAKVGSTTTFTCLTIMATSTFARSTPPVARSQAARPIRRRRRLRVGPDQRHRGDAFRGHVRLRLRTKW